LSKLSLFDILPTNTLMMIESMLKIGGKVRIGEKIGEIIRLEQRGNSTIIKVAFEEDPAKDYVCPPTKIEKVLSPH